MSDWGLEDEGWEHRAAEGGEPPDVLVVDDDPAIRDMLTYLFEDEGWTVRQAEDGELALVALEARAPDAMVLDLMMPKLDGHGVLRARREAELAPDTRTMILTAKSDAADEVWCWELGADEYMRKPVEPEDLLRELKVLLKLSADDVRARREHGLAEARRLDTLERAFKNNN